MNTYFSPAAEKDYLWFLKNNKKLAFRITQIVESIEQNPFQGLGKPEPLKYGLSGLWSRRIDKKYRIFYRLIDDETVEIVRCKGHYDDK